jgi:uncharacterized membrane protein
MIRDLVWLLSIALIAAGIAMMHIPSALIFLGLCLGVIAYFGRK